MLFNSQCINKIYQERMPQRCLQMPVKFSDGQAKFSEMLNLENNWTVKKSSKKENLKESRNPRNE